MLIARLEVRENMVGVQIPIQPFFGQYYVEGVIRDAIGAIPKP